MAREITPFTNKASWGIYNNFFWGSSFNLDLQYASEKIINKIPVSDSPINVLILGIGTGTLEFPLLASIERITKRKVNITGIDLHKEPLLYSKFLLEKGLGDIPKNTNEFSNQLERCNWNNKDIDLLTKNGLSVQNHLLICDDLDYENNEKDNIVTAHRPSKWADRLRSNSKIPSDGFDIVISSFLFTHLNWWRITLANSLQFVKINGLFMYSSGDGDTRLFEGQTNLKNKNNKIITEILLHKDHGYFSRKEINEYRVLPKPINAIRSFPIENLMNYYKKNEFKEIVDEQENLLEYKITNTGNKDMYFNMIRNRSFSAFRTIDMLIGRNKHNKVIDSVEETFLDKLDGEDNLEFDIRWQLFKRTRQPDSSFCFNERLLGLNTQKIPVEFLDERDYINVGLPSIEPVFNLTTSDSQIFSEKILNKGRLGFLREYELWTGWNEPISSKEQLGHPVKTLSEKIARYFNYKGVISSSCMGGVVRDLDGTTGGTEFKYFLNYLYPDVEIQKQYLIDLQLYLNARNVDHSNISILLSSVLPVADKPCIFIYKYSKNPDSLQLFIELVEHASFYEIVFNFPDKLSECIPLIEHEARLRIENINFDMEKKEFTFSMPIDEIRIKQIADTIKCAMRNLGIDNIGINFEGINSGNKLFIDKLQEVLKPEVVFTIWSVFIIRNAKITVAYPFTYYVDGQCKADRAALMFYDTVLNFPEIDHEYIKINLMYKLMSFSDSGEVTKKSVQMTHKEDFGHEIRGLNDFISKIIQFLIEASISSISQEQKQFLLKLASAAFKYIDLWATNKSGEEKHTQVYPTNFKNETKLIAFLKLFHTLSIEEIINNMDHIKRFIESICINCCPELDQGRSEITKAVQALLVNALYHRIKFYIEENQSIDSTQIIHIVEMSSANICISLEQIESSHAKEILIHNLCCSDLHLRMGNSEPKIYGTHSVITSLLKGIDHKLSMYSLSYEEKQYNNSQKENHYNDKYLHFMFRTHLVINR